MNYSLWSAKREAMILEIAHIEEQIANYQTEGAKLVIEIEESTRALKAASDRHDALTGRRAQLAEQGRAAKERHMALTAELKLHAGQRPTGVEV